MLVRRHRTAAGLTQEELAERAGVSWRTVSDIERGVKVTPRRDTLILLANALALSAEEHAALMAARRSSAAALETRLPMVTQAPDGAAEHLCVYIAHAQDDHAIVRQVRADLRTRGVVTWLDAQDLPTGMPTWEQAIRDALRECRALLLIASPRTRSSRYVADELRIAELSGRHVYLLWVEGAQWMECVPLGWGGLHYLDARGEHYRTALDTLTRELRGQPAPFADSSVRTLPVQRTALIGRACPRLLPCARCWVGLMSLCLP